MAITLNPTAGTKVYVSAGAPATFTTAGYTALTWTEVKGFSNVGEIGNSREVQNFDSLTDGRIKYLGIADPGQIDASMADLPADPGQMIMKTASDAPGTAANVLSLRIEGPNAKGTYAQVLVGGWRRAFGGANDVQMRMSALPIVAGTVVEY